MTLTSAKKHGHVDKSCEVDWKKKIEIKEKK